MLLPERLLGVLVGYGVLCVAENADRQMDR